MKHRLLAFGCSFTYGTALPDCYTPSTGKHGSYPSKQAWPFLLAEKLNLKCRNMAVPGNSNKTILYTILNTDFRSTDTVVIMWTFFSRHSMVVNNKCKEYSIWRENDPDSMLYYSRFYSEENAVFDSYEHINFADKYLKSRVATVVHTRALCNVREDLHHLNVQPPAWSDVTVALAMDEYYQYPKALDNTHPGPLAHAKFAEKLHQHMEII